MLCIRLKNTQRKCKETSQLFLAVLHFYLTPLAPHKAQHSILSTTLQKRHLPVLPASGLHGAIKKHVLLLFLGQSLPSRSKSTAVTFTSEQTRTSVFLIQEDRSTHRLPSQASTPGIMRKLHHSLQAKSRFLVHGVAEKI